MAKRKTIELAAKGTTSNNTHAAVEFPEHKRAAFQLYIEAVGATPTVTWKIQGSHDGIGFYDLAYSIDADNTVTAAALVDTAVGRHLMVLSNSNDRTYRYYRIVTSSNTNVTYSAKAFVGP